MALVFLRDLVDKTRKAANELGMHAVLMGILPTMRKVRRIISLAMFSVWPSAHAPCICSA